MSHLVRLFLVCFLFPAALHAYDKLQLEVLQPLKPFKMKVGEPLEIKFKALSNKTNLQYVVMFKHADGGPWKVGEGFLSLKTQKLAMGENTVKWDGQSFASDSSGKPTLEKIPKGLKAAYYMRLLIMESDEPLALFGKEANYHKNVVEKIKLPKFFLN